MNPICPTHGLEAKVMPAGTSKKTGKAYSAFFTCPNRDCTYRFPEKPTPDQTFLAGPLKADAEAEKEKNISWMNAKNVAGAIVAAQIPSSPLLQADDVQVIDEVNKIALGIYNLKRPA